MKLTKFYTTIILTLLAAATFAQQVNPQADINGINPEITQFTPKKYNAHSQIFCTVEDMRGTMYFGTVDEVLEYQNPEWKHRFIKSGMAVFSMAIDTKGIIWLGGSGDFGYLESDTSGSVPKIKDPDKSSSFVSLLHLLPDTLKNFNVIWRTHSIGNNVYFNAYEYLFVYNKNTKKISTIFPETRFFLSHKIGNRLLIEHVGKGV